MNKISIYTFVAALSSAIVIHPAAAGDLIGMPSPPTVATGSASAGGYECTQYGTAQACETSTHWEVKGITDSSGLAYLPPSCAGAKHLVSGGVSWGYPPGPYNPTRVELIGQLLIRTCGTDGNESDCVKLRTSAGGATINRNSAYEFRCPK